MKEEKTGGGERRASMGREGESRTRRRRGPVRDKGGVGISNEREKERERNQFRVAVQSNVTPADTGINVGRNSKDRKSVV